MALSSPPLLQQRSGEAIDWIRLWYWNADDLFVGSGTLFYLAAVHVVTRASRIGADNGEAIFRAEFFVRYARGDYHDIPAPDFDYETLFAAKLDAGCATVTSENFMRRAVVVMERIDAVAPGAAPVVARQKFLDRRGWLSIRKTQGGAIDEQWKPAVGDYPVVLKDVRENIRSRFGNIVCMHFRGVYERLPAPAPFTTAS